MERSNLAKFGAGLMRWGLVGASNIAAGHMIGAFRGEGGEVAWVVSGNESHARDYAERNRIGRAGTDLSDMLADPSVDAVYISSTNEKHKSQALAAIAAGKHVLCEKPLAMTVADAREMVSAALAKGIVFATNHHLRNAGSHMTIRELVQSGKIGKVLSVRVHHAVFLPPHLQGWRIDDPAAGGGVIPDITVHDADTVRFHLGEDPVEVVAMATASGMGRGVEDSVMSVWSMPSGAQVMAHESFTHAHAGTGIEVHGSLGSIIAKGVMTQQPVGEVELVTAAGREKVAFSPHDLYGQAVKRFTGAVEGRGAPAADGRDGVKSLAVALAVREAAQTGRRVRVEYGG
jgi:1,5-anhydro-D-fructose reductase (1,5-anhydro-D-mannitol-forming)